MDGDRGGGRRHKMKCTPVRINTYSSRSLGNGSVTISPETNHVARCGRVYTHAHDYHINSISNNSINFWNLEISNQSFNIVDVKPVNMEDLTGELHFFGVLQK
ncbi:hypothetical protein YC2023_061224 [Brassica napus]